MPRSILLLILYVHATLWTTIERGQAYFPDGTNFLSSLGWRRPLPNLGGSANRYVGLAGRGLSLMPLRSYRVSAKANV